MRLSNEDEEDKKKMRAAKSPATQQPRTSTLGIGQRRGKEEGARKGEQVTTGFV